MSYATCGKHKACTTVQYVATGATKTSRRGVPGPMKDARAAVWGTFLFEDGQGLRHVSHESEIVEDNTRHKANSAITVHRGIVYHGTSIFDQLVVATRVYDRQNHANNSASTRIW